MSYAWIATYYEMGLYSEQDLTFLVAAGFLTAAQKKELVAL